MRIMAAFTVSSQTYEIQSIELLKKESQFNYQKMVLFFDRENKNKLTIIRRTSNVKNNSGNHVRGQKSKHT